MTTPQDLAFDAKLEHASQLRSNRQLSRLVKVWLAEPEAQDSKVRCRRLRRAALAFNRHFRLHLARSSIETAIGLARDALDSLADEIPALERVGFIDTLGNVFFSKGAVLNDRAALSEASNLFAAAMGLIQQGTETQTWCTVANTLASIYSTRRRLDGGKEHYIEAYRLYRQIRSAAAHNRLFRDWADAVANILRMDRDNAEGDGDYAKLSNCARRARKVLAVLEDARALDEGASLSSISPLRHSLAVTLAMMADIRYERELLDEAKLLWQANLEEWPRSRSSFLWAQYCNSLAVVDMTIGENEGDLVALNRALERLKELADFPSQRKKRQDRTSAAPWSKQNAPENYSYAVTNAATIRIELAEANQLPSFLYDNLTDIGDLLHEHSFVERAVVANLQMLRARGWLALARLTKDRSALREGTTEAMHAIRTWSELEQTKDVLVALTELGKAWLGFSRGPEALPSFSEAIRYLDEALTRSANQIACEKEIAAARCLQLEARLRRAAWEGDVARVEAVASEAEIHKQELSAGSDAEHPMVTRLSLDCMSTLARIGGTVGDFAKLELVISDYLETAKPALQDAIPLSIARGHAHHRLGRINEAIEVWSTAQKALYEVLLDTGNSSLLDLGSCSAGTSGRDLAIGGGISLADELAVALIERSGPADLDDALAAIERGRASTLLFDRDHSPELIHLSRRLQQIIRLEQDAARTAIVSRSQRSRLSQLSEERQTLRGKVAAELFGKSFAELPGVSLRDVGDSLPNGNAIVVIVVAEKQGAAIIVGKGQDSGYRATVVRLPELTRERSDLLLLGTNQAGGLLGVTRQLQSLAENPSTEVFDGVLREFAIEIRRCKTGLGPILTQPVLDALASTWGADINRVCWLLPGALSPFPLHALFDRDDSVDESGLPLVHSYARSLRDIVTSVQYKHKISSSPCRMLSVDNPTGDINSPSPLSEGTRKRRGDFLVTTLAGSRATTGAILRRLEEADLLMFHGHGQYLVGDSELSGLRVFSKERSRHKSDRELAKSGILSIHDLHGLTWRVRDLAVLSACDVGATDVFDNSEDFPGLPSALLDSGFRWVIAATWPVDQRVTAQLMIHFFDALAEDHSDPAKALAVAQAKIHRSADAFYAPSLQRVTSSDFGRDERVDLPMSRDVASAYWWAGFRAFGF